LSLSFSFWAAAAFGLTDNKTGTAPAGGFSFGASTVAPTATTAAPAATTPSFGFGGSTATTAEKKDDKPAATTAGRFGFGTPATTTTTTATGTTGLPSTALGEHAQTIVTPTGTQKVDELTGNAEYVALDVKSIITNWYKELAEDAKEFERQADRINTWDKQLHENRKVLDNVVDSINRIMINQNELDMQCNSIEAYQENMEHDLIHLTQAIEREIESLQNQVINNLSHSLFYFLINISFIFIATNTR